ncbi:hypothetical protein FRACYDRAFT_196245 [Fragilariopsis cylindrus CCMP1102]|uniref:Uncharacterized protein n=1 Tax=Fragilariopsis cylindrus CCMP1102 TaxID=635003 RepID=A0A1E7ESW6_9STRA|nr:hypothetical protein FRACYDRAFT_196245 [Fragilariopsis cylindrus CCMP1102]|eukprot:OEU08653.1 hypothetical protein FRACYDRAFT_196245 [Fragilariopsis cylindrus CCMP1102]
MSKSSSSLFEISKEIQVNSPSKFPKPTYPFNDPKVEIIVTPEIGKHRPDADVVMAYAEGYGLAYYMCFIETLRATGYDGDIVLATSEYDLLAPYVLDYLKQQSNLIVYIHQLDCYESDAITPSRRIMKRGSMDIFQMCQLNNVYGYKDPITGDVTQKLKDPRIGRVVATLRYEWYWIWSQQYNSNSWIMLIDARDSFFQSNPFTNLPRNQNGLLYFFGENSDVTAIGKSTKNRNWILRSYGTEVLKAMSNKPTICSGSTMGEQIAIETYLRALINEWDETDIKMTGADQGFHNYLYYSGKLTNSFDTISKLVVWEQGKGIINNLGALRTKTFSEWGFYNNQTHSVYNWDGTLSPVAHQWDRDANLHSYYQRTLFKKWENDFITKHKKEQKEKENENNNGNLRGGE